MKLPLFLSVAALAVAMTSCTSDSTEYNGFVKNSTDNTILLDLRGDDLLMDTIYVPSGETEKVCFKTEEGDFEIYDCSSFFDTIYCTAGQTITTIIPEDATIVSISDLGSDGTRVHNCTVEIR